ncbi:MAG: hypothetical protein FWD71_18330 [Oscillospiraceae bacterium]|nr:hypothetical protein [Oscillospiraceae bacterium]
MAFRKLKIEKEEYVNRTFRLNTKLVDEMYKVCHKNGISLNKLVDICISYALENLDKDDDNICPT